MSTYFSRFAGFIPDPNAEILTEFARLATSRGWKKGGKRYKKERREYLLFEYDEHVGGLVLEGKLEQLQALCHMLGIQEAPNSIKQCKLALSKVQVNLIDLIDSLRRRTHLQIFPNRDALAKYTKDTEKYFPLVVAKKENMTKVLLRALIGR